MDETLIGGTTGIVRAGSAAVRAVQSGFVRYYAALLIVGVAARGPLLPAAELTMAPLSIMLWLPAACGVLGALLAGAGGAGRRPAAGAWLPARRVALAGALGAFGLSIGLHRRLQGRRGGLRTSPTSSGSPNWGSTTSSRSTA